MSWKPILLTLLLLLIGRSVYWTEPLGVSVDESIYMSVAETWEHFDATYSKGVDRKPPLLYGLYWAIGKVFGFFNVHAVHMIFILWMLILCFLVEHLVRKHRPNITPGLPMIFTALISSSFPRGFLSANSEHASMLPLLLGFLAFWRGTKESGPQNFFWFFVAAALAAIATAFKQVAALPFAGACFFYGLWLLKNFKAREFINLLIGVLLGVSTIYGILVWFFWARGELSDFLQWNLWDNFTYVQGGGSAHTRSRPYVLSILSAALAWPVFWWGFVQELKTKRWVTNPFFIALCGALMGAWLVTIISPRLFTHYFVPLSIFLAILASGGIADLLKTNPWRKMALGGLATSFSIFFVISTFRDETLGRWGKPAPFSKTIQAQLVELSQYIASQSQPSDRITIWGMAGQIHVMSRRGSGTRFIPADYPSGRMGGFESGAKHADSERYLKIFLDDLSQNRPLYFVDTATAGLNHYEYFQVKDYPNLYEFLVQNYTIDRVIHGITLWRRKEM